MKKLWNLLVGDTDNFKPANRTFNAINVVTFSLVCLFFMINYSLSVPYSNLVFIPAIIVQFSLYYFGRFLKIYRVPIMVYGACSYLYIMATYFLHGGMRGPSLMLFFLSFLILIAYSRKNERRYLLVLHIVIGVAVIWVEHFYPELVQGNYSLLQQRYLDISAYYTICLVFFYVVIILLRNNYNRERKLALERAQELTVSEANLRLKNEALSKIAFMQSHEFRGPLASILQVMSLIKMENYKTDPELLKMMEESVNELDNKIKSAVTLSNELNSDT
jgi:two-component system sensor histidine kinase/response regulator